MFKRRQSDTKPLLSAAFTEFVSHLDATVREEVTAKRAESIQEYFRNRSSQQA